MDNHKGSYEVVLNGNFVREVCHQYDKNYRESGGYVRKDTTPFDHELARDWVSWAHTRIGMSYPCFRIPRAGDWVEYNAPGAVFGKNKHSSASQFQTGQKFYVVDTNLDSEIGLYLTLADRDGILHVVANEPRHYYKNYDYKKHGRVDRMFFICDAPSWSTSVVRTENINKAVAAYDSVGVQTARNGDQLIVLDFVIINAKVTD